VGTPDDESLGIDGISTDIACSSHRIARVDDEGLAQLVVVTAYPRPASESLVATRSAAA
jgi:hypothetical protein